MSLPNLMPDPDVHACNCCRGIDLLVGFLGCLCIGVKFSWLQLGVCTEATEPWALEGPELQLEQAVLCRYWDGNITPRVAS